MSSRRTKSITTPTEHAKPEPPERKPGEQEKLTVDVKTDSGQLSVAGTATAVIAAIAVIGLIVLSIFVVRLAERAIEQKSSGIPASTER